MHRAPVIKDKLLTDFQSTGILQYFALKNMSMRVTMHTFVSGLACDDIELNKSIDHAYRER